MSRAELERELGRLRDALETMALARTRIVEAWGRTPSVTDAARQMYQGDVESAYAATVNAWHAFRAAAGGDRAAAEDCRRHLRAAERFLEQSASELAGVEAFRDGLLEAALRGAFETCRRRLGEALQRCGPADEVPPATPGQRVQKLGPGRYVLPCAVCSKPAATLSSGEYMGKPALVYRGIVRDAYLKPEEEPRVFAWLDAGDLRDLHRYLVDEHQDWLEDGLDAYCPTCDAAYCRDHYAVRENYDEGFYDNTLGTCPKGHVRELDD